MNILDRTEALAEDFKEYLSTRIALIKLETLDKSSDIGADVVSRVIISTAAIFSLLFVSLWLSLYLSTVLNIPYIGFLLVGAFYAFVFLVLLIGRKSMLEKPIRNTIISKAAIEDEDLGLDQDDSIMQNTEI